MKYGQNLKLVDGHFTPRNIQEVQASKLGDAQGTIFFINKNIRSSFKHYIFIASYSMCFSWSVFIFAFSFVLFAAINGWTPTYFFWRRYTPFSLPRTL
jgi:hypothetical protein